MKNKLEIMTAGDVNDPNLESLNREIWLKDKQLLRLGRLKSRGWQVTIMDTVEIGWKDFLMIVEEFKRFIPEEEEAIRLEKEDEKAFRQKQDE